MVTPDNELTNAHFREELLLVQLEIQEHGLELIRKEIYENVGQALSLVKLYLNEYFPVKDRTLNQSMALSRNLVGKAIKDLRSAAKPVTPKEIRDKGIIFALQHELDTLARIHDRKTNFTVHQKIVRFDLAKEVIVFRIMQELIGVFLELDRSKQISVQVDYQDEEVTFQVNYGMPPAFATATAGKGQRIDLDTCFTSAPKMQVRAAMINADLVFSGSPDGNLSILLKLPLTNN